MTLNNAEVGAYGYDAFEHRVWREVFSPTTATTHYIYDLDGKLLAEHNGSTGAVVKEYAWIDDMPLAVIDNSSGAPATYFIHTGPVNEPLAMTNSAKAVVWNVYMAPFGAATVFGTASAALDMRLPGQSLEAETGNLNQNWFRDYDPSLGRYIEADPLGRASRAASLSLTPPPPKSADCENHQELRSLLHIVMREDLSAQFLHGQNGAVFIQ